MSIHAYKSKGIKCSRQQCPWVCKWRLSVEIIDALPVTAEDVAEVEASKSEDRVLRVCSFPSFVTFHQALKETDSFKSILGTSS